MKSKAAQVLCVLMLVQAAALTYSARTLSPTWDEPAYLVSGLSHWQLGSFDLYSVNPPLVRTIAAAPVNFLMSPKVDWTSYSTNPAHRSEVALGQRFVELNGARTKDMFFVARLMVIPIALLGTLLCFLFAKELFASNAAGLTSAFLWCASPLALGHGGLISPDTATTVSGLAASYAFWRYLRVSSWDNAVILGVVTGLACLTKSTWLILPMVYLGVMLIVSFRSMQAKSDRKFARIQRPLQACCVAILTLLVVNGFYGFKGSMKPLGSFQFVSRALSDGSGIKPAVTNAEASQLNPVVYRPNSSALDEDKATDDKATAKCPCCEGSEPATEASAASCPDCAKALEEAAAYNIPPGNKYRDTIFAGLPVPLPQRYVEGMDVQRRDFESGMTRPEWASYLGGQWKRGGWWYFYIVGMFLKNPLALWGLLLVGSGAVLALKLPAESRVGALCLWAAPLAILFILSINTGLNRYVRYALPLLPALCIWAGASACLFTNQLLANRKALKLVSQFGVAGLLVAYCCSTFACGPHWLSYFNLAAGGSSRGHEWLLDSNVDWGQDLYLVGNWLDKHPEVKDDVALAYFGSFNPSDIGIKYRSPIPDARELAVQVLQSPEIQDPRPGWFIVSKNYLMGHPMPLQSPDGGLRFFNDQPLTVFKKFEPVDQIGNTMLVYNLDQDQVDEFRKKLGLPVIHPIVALPNPNTHVTQASLKSTP